MSSSPPSRVHGLAALRCGASATWRPVQVDRLGGPVGAAGGRCPGQDLGLQARTVRARRDSSRSCTPSHQRSKRSSAAWALAKSSAAYTARSSSLPPGGGGLAETITSGQSRAQPRSATAGELLGPVSSSYGSGTAGRLAAAVAEEGLLGPPPCLVDDRVGQLDGVKVVHDHGGMPKRCDQGAGIPAPGSQRDRSHPGQRDRERAPSQAVTVLVARSAMTSSNRPPSTSTNPVIQRVGAVGVARRWSHQAQAGHTVKAGRILDQRLAMLGHRRRCCICLVRGVLRLRRGLASGRRTSSSNATATRRVTGSSTASS